MPKRRNTKRKRGMQPTSLEIMDDRFGLRKSDSTKGPSPMPKVVSLGYVCPDVALVRLPYTQSNSINTVGVTNVNQIFNANSIFDPDFTGVGSQPLGRDEWSAFYGRYRVWRCTIVADFVNNATYPIRISLNASNTTTITSPDGEMQQKYSVNDIVGGSSAINRTRLSYSLYLPHLYGSTFAEFSGSDRYQSLMSGSPSEVASFQICASTLDGGIATWNLYYNVKIMYDCELFDRNELTVS